MRHKIKIEELNDNFKIRLAAAHGNGENKCLDMIINPALDRKWFVVNNHRTDIMQGPSLKDAIMLYNGL